MGTDLVSDIIEHIVPTRNYKPSELAPLLGVSRSCIYKWIANGAIYVPNKRMQFLVTGERAIDFCRYHADWLELYSSFDGRQKLVRPKPYMLKRRGDRPDAIRVSIRQAVEAHESWHQTNKESSIIPGHSRPFPFGVCGTPNSRSPYFRRWPALRRQANL